MSHDILPAQLVDALRQCGWLTPNHSVVVEPSTGALRRMDAHGQTVGVLTPDCSPHPTGHLQWLPATRWAAPLHAWLGPRCLWWPRGMPEGHRVAFISSRMGKPWDCHPEWFAALRRHLATLNRQVHLLVAVEHTTAAPVVRRAAQLMNVPLIWAEVGSEKKSFGDWLDKQRQHDEGTSNDMLYPARLSPPVSSIPAAESRSPSPSLDATPLRDRLLITLGQTLVVLKVRRCGAVQRLLDALFDADHPNREVIWVDPQKGRSPDSADAVDDNQTVTGQTISASPHDIQQRHRDLPSILASRFFGVSRRAPAPVRYLSDVSTTGFLVHWTRRCAGPWPGESHESYFEWLIRDKPPWDHSAWATLCRIVMQHRLIASSKVIRGKMPVVCFTAMPLAQMLAHRVFRVHRHRWDCEPYGICIRREWLEQRGTRPVRYGDDRSWAMLPPCDRPFFQKRRTRGSRPIVWEDEQEWRHAGDVSLDALPPEDGLVFVEHGRQAESLAPFCPWPLVVVGKP